VSSPRAARPRLATLAIGDELLSGRRTDTNSGLLARRLGALGLEPLGGSVLGDDEELVVARLRELCATADLVCVTGGLGPTLDDVTRQAVARAAGVELVRDEETLAWLRGRFAALGREMAETNARQADFPAGATPLANEVGTARGFRARVGGAWVVALPGPPHELLHVLEGGVLPWLPEAFPGLEPAETASFHLFGLPESEFARRVGGWMARDADPLIGVCAHGRVLEVEVVRRGVDAAARERFALRCAAFRERFAEWIFSEVDPHPADALARLLVAHGVTFCAAESCTGGALTARLVDVPGISEVLLEGLVTYSNAAKSARLGVPVELLERHGAVSAEVAAAMALGAARTSGARLAVSTTGVAGPGGGTPEKPVGLVHVGVALDGAVETHELRLPPHGRARIRDWTVTSACELARRALVRALEPA
jgi:nicotinamide-nucleotide amidase